MQIKLFEGMLRIESLINMIRDFKFGFALVTYQSDGGV